MWTSERAAPAVVLAALLGAATAAGAQPGGRATVTLQGAGLALGTVLPGAAPVVVAPWSVDHAAERAAAVFEITGEPGATVRIQFSGLPRVLRNSAGSGTLAIAGYTAQYNTVNGPGGATSFTPTPSPVAFVLNAAGRGWVSVGATVSASAAQPRGAYTLDGAAVIKVQ